MSGPRDRDVNIDDRPYIVRRLVGTLTFQVIDARTERPVPQLVFTDRVVAQTTAAALNRAAAEPRVS